MEFVDADFLRVGNSVPVLVSEVFQPDGFLAVMRGEQVSLLALVAGRDEPLQPKRFEVVGKLVEEHRNAGIVAVAEDRLAPKMLLVVA